MNTQDEKEKAVAAYAEKHGCSVAAARIAMSRKIGQPVVFDKTTASPIANGPEHISIETPKESAAE